MVRGRSPRGRLVASLGNWRSNRIKHFAIVNLDFKLIYVLTNCLAHLAVYIIILYIVLN